MARIEWLQLRADSSGDDAGWVGVSDGEALSDDSVGECARSAV